MRIRRMRSCGSAPRLRRALFDRALTFRTWYWPRGRRRIGSGSRSEPPWLRALTGRWPTCWMRWPDRFTTASTSPGMPSSFCRIQPPAFCLCSARSWPSISAMRGTWWCWRRRTWSCAKTRRPGCMVERPDRRHTSGRWPATAVWPLCCRSFRRGYAVALALSCVGLGHYHRRVTELALRLANICGCIGLVGAGLGSQIAELEGRLFDASAGARCIEPAP